MELAHFGQNSIELIGPTNNLNVGTNTEGPASSVMARRRASIRVVKEFVKKCSVREKFFSNREADVWNGLDDGLVASSSVNQFKKMYDNERSKTNNNSKNTV